MNTLVTAAFVRELEILVSTLKSKGDPCLDRFLPFYSPDTLRQLVDHWNTINCLRQELSGVQASLQQLSSLVVAQTQQLTHPSSCSKFSLHIVEPVTFPSQPIAPPPRPKPSKPKAKKTPAAAVAEVTPAAQQVSPPEYNTAPPALNGVAPDVSLPLPAPSPPKKKKKSSKRPREASETETAAAVQTILDFSMPPQAQANNWEDNFLTFSDSPQDTFNLSEFIKLHQ